MKYKITFFLLAIGLTTFSQNKPVYDTVVTVNESNKSLKLYELYNSNGILVQKFSKLDNKYQGQYSKYFENGMLSQLDEYDKGKKNGKTLYIATNNVVLTEQNYTNDMMNGPRIEYLGGKVYLFRINWFN